MAIESPQSLRAEEQKSELVPMSPWSKAPPSFPPTAEDSVSFWKVISVASYLPSRPVNVHSQPLQGDKGLVYRPKVERG